MTRFAPLVALAFVATLGAAGCDKPDESHCREAIDHMRVLMGTEKLSDNNKLEGEVRRCKGGSTKKAVQCAIDAKTYQELRACGFSKLPADLPVTPTTNDPTTPTTGSAAGSGSATAGSGSATAGAGSATAGSAMAGSGSAAAGSGSAAAGSAMAGSGSATAGSAMAGSATAGSAMAGSGSATAGSAMAGSAK